MDTNDQPKHSQGEVILYRTNDGRTEIELHLIDDTVWLTQSEIAELFDTTKQNVSLHIKNIYSDGEQDGVSVVKEYLTTAADGKRYTTKAYALNMILAIGYRVRSPRGVQFRQWATRHLSEYLVKGFAMDDERLKNPQRSKYFTELLARIRDIRASEKMFYQQVRDLFALSDDYENRKNESPVRQFFASVQNMLLYAITEHTAAELIVERADPKKLDMGLTSYEGDRPRKSDVIVAKNYLNEDELAGLNRLVTMFLDQAEFAVQRRQQFTLSYWQQAATDLLRVNRLPILEGFGTVSREQMVEVVTQHLKEFDDNRRAAEALEVDAYEVAEFETLQKEIEMKLAQKRGKNKS